MFEDINYGLNKTGEILGNFTSTESGYDKTRLSVSLRETQDNRFYQDIIGFFYF